jgi:integrase
VYTALLTTGQFQPATIRITHNVCRQALDDAVDWGLIPSNPALRAKPPRVPQPAIRPPTLAEAQALLKQADGHPWRALWYTIALTGCRRGEALGL